MFEKSCQKLGLDQALLQASCHVVDDECHADDHDQSLQADRSNVSKNKQVEKKEMEDLQGKGDSRFMYECWVVLVHHWKM